MAHLPSSNPRHGAPSSSEQEASLNLWLLNAQAALMYPSVSPGFAPASAPGNAPTAGLGGPQAVPHGYDLFVLSSSSIGTAPTYSAGSGFMQPDPTTQSPSHGYESRTWTSPTDEQSQWAATPLLPDPHPLATDHAAVHGPASIMGPPPPQHPPPRHMQDDTKSAPRSLSFIERIQQQLTGSSSADLEKVGGACWRCKDLHKKCDAETPCQRCRKSSGKSAIPCQRGPVCAVAGLPFVCRLPPKSRQPKLPYALLRVAEVISDTRRRRQEAINSTGQGTGYQQNLADVSILFRVVANTRVPNIRKYQKVDDILPVVELPYDDLIVNIVWELEDNPDAAQLMGIGAVEGLVALLEAASLCETKYGHYYEVRRRVVYLSMVCLWGCLEAMRLSLAGVLTPDAHSHCTKATECVFPGLRGLSKYIFRYAEALTMALFSKKRREMKNWLLIFYSLCIQGPVRRTLMFLEQRHPRPMNPSDSGAHPEPDALSGASYLQTPVYLFRQISTQGDGRLARQIRSSRAKPSIYLQQLPHPPQPIGGGTWEPWYQEGVPEFLGRIFQLPSQDFALRRHHPLPVIMEAPSANAESDSDDTITHQPPHAVQSQPQAQAQAPVHVPMQVQVQAQAQAQAQVQVQEVVGGGQVVSSWAFCIPGHTPVPSIYSVTSYGDSIAFDGMVTPSSASFAGSGTPSMRSVDDMSLDDSVMEDFDLGP